MYFLSLDIRNFYNIFFLFLEVDKTTICHLTSSSISIIFPFNASTACQLSAASPSRTDHISCRGAPLFPETEGL